ncbi:MAG: DUF3291 domain-containing protein [Bacteroidota bacterium]
MSENITTLTFLKYATLKDKIWGFGMMQFAHAALQRQQGIKFYKLMGSGKGFGFNPLPDWSTYALLVVWENEKYANDFFKKADLFKKYQSHTKETWTLFLKNIMARGEWSQQNPFEKSNDLDPHNNFLCIITRATIKWNKLITFWKYVPTSEKPLLQNDGLMFTKGIGEVPIVQMATFSVWKDKKSLLNFAYKSKEHRKAIEKTKSLNWYSEELFSRFQPYRSEGTWEGNNPLQL